MHPASQVPKGGKITCKPTTRETFCSPYTINLTGETLEENTIKLLDKGLTFIPKVKAIAVQPLYDNFNNLSRRLMLADYFEGCESASDRQDFDRMFVHPSSWTPKTSLISIETRKTIQQISSGLEDLTKNRINIRGQEYIPLKGVKYNLSKAEHDALTELQHRKSFIIKPADKGGAVVVMKKELYVQEGIRQLHNSFYYKQLDYPIFPGNVQKINRILYRIHNKGLISTKQLHYLQATNFDKQRYFYLLPKVHKDREKWPNTHMPEGRPIVADCGSESYRVSKYIDYFLQPLATSHDSYLKDTYDFISKIRHQPIKEDWFLVTADVTALYTNMRIDLILKSVQEAFAANPAPRRPDSEILELLELTLRNNDFEFAGEVFLQTVGTAMGKTYAPSLANLYLQQFDKQAKTGYHIKPHLYYRFLDDIHLIWPSTREDLVLYEQFLNSLIPGIKISFTVRESFIEFLDTTVYKALRSDGHWELRTKVYFKPTDTHQLLHSQSAHPKHTCQGVLKSQFIRFKRISSSQYDYLEACLALWEILQFRGYNRSTYRNLKRDIWLNYNTAPERNHNNVDKEILPVINYFDPIGAKFTRIAKEAIRQNEHFEKFKIVSAYKIHKNLRRHLIKNGEL